MTRTVRIELPALGEPTERGLDVVRLLTQASAQSASELLLTSGAVPSLRIAGEMVRLQSEPAASAADITHTITALAPRGLHAGPAPEWTAEIAELGRVRCVTFDDRRGPGLLLRLQTTGAVTADQLRLPAEARALVTTPSGLVLVGGLAGSGRTSVLSALVDSVNHQRAGVIVTLERQVRFVHQDHVALVSQREVRGDLEAAVPAVRSVLREAPDMLVVDDLLSPALLPILLSAAADGTLVIVSLTSASTVDAVQQLLEMVPADSRPATARVLARCLQGAVVQRLFRRTRGGRIAACDVMPASPPILQALADGDSGRLADALDESRKDGALPFADSVAALVRDSVIDARDALRHAPDRDRLRAALERHGAFVERRA